MRIRRKTEDSNQENIFWVTMSDLFLGMFMVFATLFFAFVTNSGQGNGAAQEATQEMVQEVVKEMSKQNIKVKMINEDKPEAPKPNERIDVEIDPQTGLVRISNLQLFALNSSELTPSGRAFLNKFIPVYFDCIYKKDLSKYVSSVVIQGHTDTTNFKGNYTVEQQYMKNMELSLNRAYEVANYMTNTPYNKENGDRLRKMIIVEGASFSEPIIENGKENFDKSRRVELKVTLKSNNS